MRIALVLALLALPATHAQIRVYDAKSGRNVEATGVSLTTPRETITAKPKPVAVSATVAVTKPAPHATGTWTPSGTYVGRDLLENEVYLPRGADDPIRTEVGEVYVFTSGNDFSPVVADRMNEIKRINGIEPVFYLNDMEPQAYFSLLEKGFGKLAEDVELGSDAGGREAARLGVTTSNVIVYKGPNGVIRQYNLLTEIDAFRNALERTRYNQAREAK